MSVRKQNICHVEETKKKFGLGDRDRGEWGSRWKCIRHSLGLVSSSRPHRRPRITGLKVRSKPNYVSHSDSPRAITISACMTSLQRVMICSDLLFSEDALLEQKSSIKREKVKSQRNVIQGERRSTKMDKSSLGLLSWRGGLPCRQNSLSVRVIL